MAAATPPGAGARTSLSEAGRRPSLFSASADETVRIEPETSIMAALDGRLAKPAVSRPTWTLWGGAGALGIAAGVAAWWWTSGGGVSAVAPVAGVVAASELKVAQAPVAVPAAEAAMPAVPASAPGEVASLPARAVIEETAAGEAKSAVTTAPAVAAAAMAVPAAVAVATAGAAAVVTEVPAAKSPKAKEKAALKPATATPVKVPSKEPAKAAVAETMPAAESASRSLAPGDADVELLAALMHYSDEVGGSANGKGRAQSSATRMNELTIADLVKRCQALGGDDATQCKKRICSGYWGKAEACPAKQAPAPSKPKKKTV